MHQYEYHGKEKTIIYYVQIEWYNNDLNEKSSKVNYGEQRILTHEGYILPLQFSQGFSYIPMHPYY